jgi:mannose-6-phosphate isomerase-like protein (cupin superfamily)
MLEMQGTQVLPDRCRQAAGEERMNEMGAATPPFIGSVSRAKWQEFPGHFRGALSKELVSRGLVGTRKLDLRISHYQPMAWVEEHVHSVQEQVYFVLGGEGSLVLDGVEHVLRVHDYVWIPPRVRHSFTACGLEPLLFLVLSAPAQDET